MKKILVLIICVLITLSFVACSSNDNSTDIETSTSSLASFETYDEIMHVELTQRFGKLDRNSNKQYVSNGEYSMTVYPYGDFEDKVEPKLSIMFQSKYIEKNDFSNVVYSMIDIYNANMEEKTIEVDFKSKNYSDNDIYLPIQTYVLKPQSWNTIVYNFNNGAMVESYCLKNMQAFEIVFKNHRMTSEKYTPDTYYIDNFVCYEASGITYNPARGSNELLSFENPNDVYQLTRSANCNIEVNTNLLYVAEGKISAKITKLDANNGVISLEKGIFGVEKFYNASEFSLDIFNGDQFAGYYQLKFIYEDEDLIERTYSKSKVINACEKGSISISLSDLREGVTFENILRIELQLASSICYIDNIMVR